MASQFVLLLDDIAAIADDVATMSKMAIKKTSGVLGDDLALNAQQVNGVKPSRELFVVWSVFKGSLINKIILVPIILLLNFFFPQLLIPLLMIGGAFLCFEGVEAILHKIFHKEEAKIMQAEHIQRIKDESLTESDILEEEKGKIKGAIKTDFILSAEILVISLSTMAAYSTGNIIIAMIFISILFTLLVYGFVALIVRADDLGLYLRDKYDGVLDLIGQGIINFMPYVLKALSFIGVVAMLLVGGSIILHGTPLYPIVKTFSETLSPVSAFLVNIIAEFIAGILSGLLVVGIVKIVKKLMPSKKI